MTEWELLEKRSHHAGRGARRPFVMRMVWVALVALVALLACACDKGPPASADHCGWTLQPSTDTGKCVIPPDAEDAGVQRQRLQMPLVKLGQLVGDQDFEYSPPAPTLNLTQTRVGLWGTDRGSSFMHNGQLYFLFGDSVSTLAACSAVRPFNADAIAVLDLPLGDAGLDPMALDGGLPLRFLTAGDGDWLPVTLDGQPLLSLTLPLAGWSHGADVYAFFSVGRHSAVLGVAHDNGSPSSLAAYTSGRAITEKMLNVFPLQVPTASVAGLGAPWSGDTLLVWGRPASATQDAGDPIYLAAAPFDDVGNTGAWLYYAGGTPGSPAWMPGDSNAVPIDATDVPAQCGGGFSITYLPGLDRWLLLERCDGPKQILYRVARSVLGPWSEERVFFDPVKDSGFGHFMHEPGCDQDFNPTLVGPVTEGTPFWGPTSEAYPYAPFVVGPSVQWSADAGTVSFVLLISVFNPYSPMVMRATMTATDVGP